MDWKTFVDLIAEWATANETKIAQCWPQKGGWEEWAKSEIFSYVGKKVPSADIKKEQRCWATKDVDFLLNDGGAPGEIVLVEMKAQSLENYTNFLPELKKDVGKLSSGLKPKYTSATLVAVGLYFTEHKTSIPEYFTTHTLGKGEIGICYAVDLQ